LRNVVHYEFPTTVPSPAQLQAFVNVLDNDYKDNLQTPLSPNVSIHSYDVRRVDIGDQPTLTLTPAAGAWVGGSTGEQLPEQLAALVTWRAFSTFPRTTRSYIFPFTEADNTGNGNLSAASLAFLEAFALDVMSILYEAGLSANKVAVEYGGTPRVVVASNAVTTREVSPHWATQRRRRLGVGS
jgi:hypothetical protein